MEQKEIFSEFLKDDALSSADSTPKVEKQPDTPMHFPEQKEVESEELQLFWEQLRHFFQTGEQVSEPLNWNYHPALLADFLKRAELSTDYPFYLAIKPEESISLRSLLENAASNTFDEKEARILKENLPRLEGYFRKHCKGKDLKLSFPEVALQAIADLEELDVHGEEGKRFLEDLNRFREALPADGWLLDFTPNTPFLLLDHLLSQTMYAQRMDFLARVDKLSASLREILSVEESKSGNNKEKGDLDFANSMIEFEKLGQIMPESASEEMPARRKDRIRNTLRQLEKAENLLAGYHAHIIINEELFQNDKYVWEIVFSNSKIVQSPNGKSCSSAFLSFRENIEPFTRIIAAARIAELELQGKYRDEVHDPHFEFFNWRHFTTKELRLFPPVILVAHTQEMLDEELADFSRLLASNTPITLITLQHQHPFALNINGNKKLDFYTFKQELGAMSIAHRDAFTFQDAMNHPGNVLQGLRSGLLTQSPAVFTILSPWSHEDQSNQAFLNVSAAVESRHFPVFTYNQDQGEQWGSRFDISQNPQVDNPWPVYPLEVLNSRNEKETLQLAFTYADYYALDPSHKHQLLPIPPAYWTSDLIPMSEYLEAAPEELYGKIPYIWMANGAMELHRVALPFSVIIACKERLDYWKFIQEVGGINSYHVKKAISRQHKEWEDAKAKEIAEIEERHSKELEEVRSNAAGDAMEQLAAVLLDWDNFENAPAFSTTTAKRSKEVSESEEVAQTVKEQPNEEKEKEIEEEEISMNAEPWVETIRCTSCNECVDMYPSVFKYNEDKQAYIADATNATYAELVRAAEECPAACIHPGLPEDPGTEGMDELIKRAKPFN